jgi:hypothetical protein
MMESSQAENMYFNEEIADDASLKDLGLKANSRKNTMKTSVIWKEFRRAQDNEQDPENKKYWYINGKLEPASLADDVDLPEDPLDYSIWDDGLAFDHPDAEADSDSDR